MAIRSIRPGGKNCLKVLKLNLNAQLVGFANNMLGNLAESNNLNSAKNFYFKAYDLDNSNHTTIFNYTLIHLYLGIFDIGSIL